MDNSNAFGTYLKMLRKSKKLSIYQLSKDADISHAYISQIEHGHKEAPMPVIIRKLSQSLGCTHIGMMIKAGHVTEEEVLTFRKEQGIDDRL